MYIRTQGQDASTSDSDINDFSIHVLLCPTPASLTTVGNLYLLFLDPASFLTLPCKEYNFFCVLLFHCEKGQECSGLRNVKDR